MSNPLPTHITTKLLIKNMVCKCCIRVLTEDLGKIGVVIEKMILGEAIIAYDPSKIDLKQIEDVIVECGFELLVDKEKILAEQIKLAVIELIHYYNNANSLIRNSDYLIEKLGYTYQHLSSVFSKHENTTLEKYIIAHKIEKVKEMIEFDNLTLSEISYMMGYSSVQYLSNQFKTITGVSVTDYKKSPIKNRKFMDDLI
ncbi:MAG: AraC family transcriptional regulator [Bacteroidetes bacterium]|nr:AraC family transcriptional regulator [Bacteroidota bacterium]